MARIKKCLDDSCTQFILLDDGRTIAQPKDHCDVKKRDIQEYAEQFAEIARESKTTIYTSGQLIKDPKVGRKVEI